MVAFRDTLESCGLVDLGFTRVPFTYDNKRPGANNVRVRLERAVATNDWRNMFVFSSVLHVPSPCPDHVALVLKGAADEGTVGPKNRRYELFWERDGTLPDVIRNAWEAAGGVQNLNHLRDALAKTMSSLSCWSKKFGNVTRELAKSRSQLEELMHMNVDQQNIQTVLDRKNELLYQEEML